MSTYVREKVLRIPMDKLDIANIREKYGDDIVVLLAFGTTLLSVAENIKKIAENHTLFIPEVPLYGTDLFTYEYYLQHLEEIESAYQLFADDESKKVYEDMIGFRLSGEPKLLANAESMALSYEKILGGRCYRCAIDCGAYKGDSTEMMARVLRPEKIIAVEPDPKTFLKLSAYAENELNSAVKTVNAAVGKECGAVEFMSSASRGSGKEGISKSAKCREVALLTVDEIAKGEAVDLLKLDVEGDEADAIEGSLETIKRCSPSMAISVYHRTEDIYALAKKVKELLPSHSLYLRREECIPAWDITLFAKRN